MRFCDAKDVSRIFATKTAVGGVSIDHKDGGGGLNVVGDAAARRQVEWEMGYAPFCTLEHGKPAKKEFAYLFPKIDAG